MKLSYLYQKMVRHFDISELQNLCFELNVDYENLNGLNKSDKCRELITYLQRRGRLDDLIEICLRQRPNVVWREQANSRSFSTEPKERSVISVLFLAADPTNATRLRLGEEFREIQEKLQLAKLRDSFELHQRTSLRPSDISQAMLDVYPKIVHFSGHGSAKGELFFEDLVGKAHPVQPDALSALFEQFAKQVECVVLNACYSKIQARGISEHIEHVIGMNQAVGDKAAIAFTIGFYQALGAGRTIEEAYNLGCVQIGLQGIQEQLTPMLLKKAQ